MGVWDDSKVHESIKIVDADLAAPSKCGSGAFVVLRGRCQRCLHDTDSVVFGVAVLMSHTFAVRVVTRRVIP